MNSIPFNGRIAIIDDQLEHALPLINVLSQNQRPLTYFSGDVKFLPTKENQVNDIRVLFLDINLIDDREHEDKVLKGRLVPVLDRIISEKNFPYVIIYWSREDKKLKEADKYKSLVEDIFNNDLKNRKPIGYLSADKIQFFNLDGSRTEDIEQRINELFEKVTRLIDSQPSYNHLLKWENAVHHSADQTLQDVFSSYHTFDNWSENANFIITKLGESYAGRANYKSQDHLEKVKSSFQAFNSVFIDSLEFATSGQTIAVADELNYDEEHIKPDSIYAINKKLLISDDKEPSEYSGAVIEDVNPKSDKVFEDLLNNSFARTVVENKIKQNPANEGKNQKAIDKLISDKRKEIRQSWKKIYFVLTPLCDFVQKKFYNVKTVKGMIIKSEYLECIDNKSEAIFISPKFLYDGEICVIVLHFRYFFTSAGAKGIKFLNPLFRVRQQLFAEVQSKLARHINRQGILYLE